MTTQLAWSVVKANSAGLRWTIGFVKQFSEAKGNP